MEDIFNKLLAQISNQQNEIKSSLDGISQNINGFNGVFSEFSKQVIAGNNGFWNDYGSAVIGLFGVLVGAAITYWSSRKIQKFDAKTRLTVQKKNLVYAPIYKEFLKLTKYLNENKDTCYLNIICTKFNEDWYNEYYFNGKRRESGRFILWNDIRDDIRKNYIPSKIRRLLDDVSRNIENYSRERKNIEDKFEKLVEEKVNSIRGERTNVSLLVPHIFFSKGSYSIDENEMDKITNGMLKRDDYKDMREGAVSLLGELAEQIDRKNFFAEYDNLASSIKETSEEIDKLIQFVINKYEYGEELEKYE